MEFQEVLPGGGGRIKNGMTRAYCMFRVESIVSVHFFQQVINCSDPRHFLVNYIDVLTVLSLVSPHLDIVS